MSKRAAAKEDVTVTMGSGDVMEDLGLTRKRPRIGDTITFVDASGIRWQGTVTDIRGGVGFVSVLGQPATTPLLFDWWIVPPAAADPEIR